VGPRTGLEDVKKRKFLTLPGLELRPLFCPASSQSLYRLSYPGSIFEWCINEMIVSRFFPHVFPTITLYAFFFFPIRATCPDHPILPSF
jgi:hypothetical protein